MALFVKDPEVDALAERLMTLTSRNKTEAVRRALQNEIDREQAKIDLVEVSVAFARRLRARGAPERGDPAEKAFIDSLYEDR